MRSLTFVCNVLVATSLVGCAADDTSDEDAIADAASPGKADAPSFPLGIFNAWDVGGEEDEGLHAAFHADGSMDYTKYVEDGDTRYYVGEYKVYKYRGRDRLRLTDEEGRVVFRGDWSLDGDNDLVFGGDTWTSGRSDDPNVVADCTAFKVEDTSFFEEGFTEYEYPDVQITKDGDAIELSLGAGSVDSTEGEFTLTDGARELALNADLDDQVLEVTIPKAGPRRGVINYESLDEAMHVMARLVCH